MTIMTAFFLESTRVAEFTLYPGSLGPPNLAAGTYYYGFLTGLGPPFDIGSTSPSPLVVDGTTVVTFYARTTDNGATYTLVSTLGTRIKRISVDGTMYDFSTSYALPGPIFTGGSHAVTIYYK